MDMHVCNPDTSTAEPAVVQQATCWLHGPVVGTLAGQCAGEARKPQDLFAVDPGLEAGLKSVTGVHVDVEHRWLRIPWRKHGTGNLGPLVTDFSLLLLSTGIWTKPGNFRPQDWHRGLHPFACE